MNCGFTSISEQTNYGFIAFGTENKFYEALMIVLNELYGEKSDYISWWLYEASDDYTVETVDGSQKWDLREPEALYDYLVEEN